MKPLQTCALDRVATGICTFVHSNRYKTNRSDITLCVVPWDDKQCQKSQAIINLEVTYVAMDLKCTDSYTRNQKREYEDKQRFRPIFCSYALLYCIYWLMLKNESEQKTTSVFTLKVQQHSPSQCCHWPARLQRLSVAQTTQLLLS